MHISPESSMYGESVSTLNFAKRVSEVTLGQVRKLHSSCRTATAANNTAGASDLGSCKWLRATGRRKARGPAGGPACLEVQTHRHHGEGGTPHKPISINQRLKPLLPPPSQAKRNVESGKVLRAHEALAAARSAANQKEEELRAAQEVLAGQRREAAALAAAREGAEREARELKVRGWWDGWAGQKIGAVPMARGRGDEDYCNRGGRQPAHSRPVCMHPPNSLTRAQHSTHASNGGCPPSHPFVQTRLNSRPPEGRPPPCPSATSKPSSSCSSKPTRSRSSSSSCSAALPQHPQRRCPWTPAPVLARHLPGSRYLACPLTAPWRAIKTCWTPRAAPRHACAAPRHPPPLGAPRARRRPLRQCWQPLQPPPRARHARRLFLLGDTQMIWAMAARTAARASAAAAAAARQRARTCPRHETTGSRLGRRAASRAARRSGR